MLLNNSPDDRTRHEQALDNVAELAEYFRAWGVAFERAAADVDRLARRVGRYSELVAGEAMTPEEQQVFDMLGDDEPCER